MGNTNINPSKTQKKEKVKLKKKDSKVKIKKTPVEKKSKSEDSKMKKKTTKHAGKKAKTKADAKAGKKKRRPGRPKKVVPKPEVPEVESPIPMDLVKNVGKAFKVNSGSA